MSKDDFARTLRDAPMAPNQDTVTVIGTVARTANEDEFVLTVAGGQTFTIPVDAVKSSRTMAGAVGQSVVELALNASALPERMRDDLGSSVAGAASLQTVPVRDYTIAWVDYSVYWTDQTLYYADHTIAAWDHTGIADLKIPEADVGPGKVIGDPQGGNTLAENIGPGIPGGDPGVFTPFTLAAPHQASAATMAALMGGAVPAGFKPPWRDGIKRPAEDGTFPIPRPPYHTWDF
ncbi:MAG: hypothetical protein JOY70_10815 [Acidisphaera sp.]|nr:hypothetical protein [Acidisphaera sp.]